MTVKKFEVEPLVGVGPIRLGMTRSEARKSMPTKPEPFRKSDDDEHDTDAFHQNGFQVFYAGKKPLVEYIELSRDSGFTVLLEGIDVFKTPADHLVEKIQKKAPYDEDDPELGESYIFPALELSLWRSAVPDEEDPDDDEGRFFDTIGVGVKGYYSEM